MKIPSRAKWYYRVAGISGVLIAAAHRPTLSSEVPCSCNLRHWAYYCRKSGLKTEIPAWLWIPRIDRGTAARRQLPKGYP